MRGGGFGFLTWVMGATLLLSCRASAPRPATSGTVTPAAAGSAAAKLARSLAGDDRQEDFEFADSAWLSKLQSSTSALIMAEDLDLSDPTAVRVVGPSLAEVFSVCPGVPFASEPASAKCSATLIAPDLVLTAGHCTRELACKDMRFVFNYAMQATDRAAPIRESDVFACQQVVVDSVGDLDYGVVRLDRPAVSHTAAKVRLFQAPVRLGQSLLVAGHPSGLPRKISSRGRVTDARAQTSDYFLSDLYGFPGSSGAGVFEPVSGELVGSVMGGLSGTGYTQREDEACWRPQPVSARAREPIHITYAAAAIAALCQKHPAAGLCPCGNRECEGAVGESSRTCPGDCGSQCGDGVCNGHEDGTGCYADCGACGNGVCEAQESARLSCCNDCGCPAAYACGNGTCRPALGNANVDGAVDAQDLVALQSAAAGKQTTPLSTEAADVDCDGSLSLRDVDSLREHLGPRHRRLPCNVLSDIAVGSRHTCALLGSGQVRCWGSNSNGQLGRAGAGAVVTASAAKPLRFSSKVLAVAAGGDHTCVLLEDKTVRCWGAGSSGQLGYGDRNDRTEASQAPAVPLGGAALSIAVGAAHSCAILVGGRVTCWGSNHHGELGLGHTKDVGDDETPERAGRVDLGPARVRQLALGATHSCALTERGAVFCWGSNTVGELGLGHSSNVGDDEQPLVLGPLSLGAPAVQVAVGALNSCAVLADGGLRCWGDNRRGQLGYAMQQRGQLPSAQGLVPTGGKIASVAVGTARVCALYTSGEVRCWGNNSQGQLGLGNVTALAAGATPATLPSLVLGGAVRRLSTRADHTCALLEDQSLRCWGDNSMRQLGTLGMADVGDDESPALAGQVPLFGTTAGKWHFVNELGLAPKLMARRASEHPCQYEIAIDLGTHALAADLEVIYRASGGEYPLLFGKGGSTTRSLLLPRRSPMPGAASLDNPGVCDTVEDYSAQDGLGGAGWFPSTRIQALDAESHVIYGWVRSEE